MNAWPKIADMLITTGWTYGVRTADIAAAVAIATGREVTRDAVIGRAHRCGLPRHPLARRPPAADRPPSAPAAQAAA